MSNLSLSVFLAVAACVIGGALGGFALARPLDALALVGLKPDEDKPHALSEARATYGGLFVLSHAGTAAALGYSPAIGACMALALALCWGGAGLARAWSLARDEAARTPFNIRASVFELLMGAALWLPFWGYARLIGGDGVHI